MPVAVSEIWNETVCPCSTVTLLTVPFSSAVTSSAAFAETATSTASAAPTPSARTAVERIPTSRDNALSSSSVPLRSLGIGPYRSDVENADGTGASLTGRSPGAR